MESPQTVGHKPGGCRAGVFTGHLPERQLLRIDLSTNQPQQKKGWWPLRPLMASTAPMKRDAEHPDDREPGYEAIGQKAAGDSYEAAKQRDQAGKC
jgi:hypothetical protein